MQSIFIIKKISLVMMLLNLSNYILRYDYDIRSWCYIVTDDQMGGHGGGRGCVGVKGGVWVLEGSVPDSLCVHVRVFGIFKSFK